MNSKTKFSALIARLLVAFVAFGGAAAANAQVQLQITNAANKTTANVTSGELISFTYQYQCSSTTVDGVGVKVTTVLDPNLEFVSATGSIHTASETYSAGSRTVTFTFVDPLPAGSTGDVRIQAKFVGTTPDGTIASNVATIDGSNASAAVSNSVGITAYVPPTGGDPTYTTGPYISKTGGGSVYLPYDDITFYIDHGNNGGPSEDIANYVVTDNFPAGVKLERFTIYDFPGTSNDVFVYYTTNLNSGWSDWNSDGSPTANSGSHAWRYVSSLTLAPGEYVTGLQFNYGLVPGAAGFHSNLSSGIYVYLDLIDPASFTSGDTIENCASVTGTGYSENSCSTATVQDPIADLKFWVWDNTVTAPYAPGETFQMGGTIGSDDENSVSLVDPLVAVLLPAEFEYAGNPYFSGDAYYDAGTPAPVFTKIDDFAGTGRTLVRWAFPGVTIVPDGDDIDLNYYFDVTAKTNTAYGNYTFDALGGWDQPQGTGYGWMVVDEMDADGDGDTTEMVAKDTATVTIGVDPGAAAGVEAVKWAKGELDATPSKYPATAKTIPGGQADYRLVVRNPGQVQMTNVVLIDVLPHLGDKGVLDTSGRGSQWQPFLAGAVTAPSGISVLYSTSANPCRDELTPGLPAGCDAPNWTTSPPSDITTVRSLKFDFGGKTLFPAEEVVIEWPMRAPLSAPTNGEIAWNSFGYIATRADDGVQALPSEPIKVGIELQAPSGGAYGDRVWVDSDKNGVQDSGESGLNGVRVDLFEDDGDGIANPNSDTFVKFTVTTGDGAYAFNELDPGDYYAAVHLPGGFALSPTGAGTPTTDSDGMIGDVNGIPAAIMPVTTYTGTEQKLEWDLGLTDRDTLPAVWAMKDYGSGLLIGGRFSSSHGVARSNIAVLNGDGTVDPSFNPGTGFDGPVRSLDVLGNGQIVTAGGFGTYNGTARNGVALLNGDGTLGAPLPDPVGGAILWIGKDSSGNILYAGGFSKIGSVASAGLGRVTPTGSIDSSFTSGLIAGSTVCAVELQDSGKILVAGNFSTYAGAPAGSIVRLSASGTRDTSFDVGAGPNGMINWIQSQTDGKVVVVGDFTVFSGKAANGTVRLMPDGTVDMSMGESSLSISEIRRSN